MKSKLNYNEIKGRRVLKPWGELAAGTGGVRCQNGVTQVCAILSAWVTGLANWCPLKLGAYSPTKTGLGGTVALDDHISKDDS